MKIKMIMFILVIFLYPANAPTFDKETPNMPALLGYPEYSWKSTIVDIFTIGTSTAYITDGNSTNLVVKDAEFKMGGSGIVVKGANKNNYIISAAHTVIPGYVIVDKSYTQTHKIDNRVIRVSGAGEANIIWYDEKMDLVILSCSEKDTPLIPSQYNVSNKPYKLKTGDALATIVKVRDKDGDRLSGLEVRKGKVISPSALLNNPISLSFFNEFDVVTNIGLLPGDSGSPVFAFRNGMPVLVGIVRAILRKADKSLCASYFVRVDPIIKFLETNKE